MSQIIKAGIVIGIGLMGFFDGIVFHQVLQWHHVVCYTAYCKPNTLAELQLQTYQDGMFHAAVWFIVLIGVFMLFRAATQFNIRSRLGARVFAGALLIGAGIFNFVEGLIDHQILGIHHVLPGPNQFTADMVFLASGIVLPFIGYLYIRREKVE